MGALAAPPVSAQRIAPLSPALGTASSGLGHTPASTSALASPARLGWHTSPGITVSLPSVGATLGLRPVTGRDLARYSGDVVPRDVREQWLATIEADGRQRGHVTVRATPFGVVSGRFAAFVSSIAEGASALNADAAEALLFGNAGRTGLPTRLDFDGSRAEGWALTTFGFSAGAPLETIGSRIGGRFSVGATGKVTLGHAYWSAQDAGSGSSLDPITLQGLLPVLATSTGAFSRGVGFGIDLAAAWSGGGWIVDLVVHDVVNRFDWKTDALEFRRSEVLIGPDSTFEGTERLAFDLAPVALRSRAESFGFERSVTLAVGRDLPRGWRGVAEIACGPDPFESGASDVTDRACRVGASTARAHRQLAFTGGVAAGRGRATLGVGIGWVGRRLRVDLSYGRHLGDAPASAFAMGATLRSGRDGGPGP